MMHIWQLLLEYSSRLHIVYIEQHVVLKFTQTHITMAVLYVSLTAIHLFAMYDTSFT